MPRSRPKGARDKRTVLTEEVPRSATLADLIVFFQEMDLDLIVEHNGRFAFPQKDASIQVAPNDRVEFVHPNFGG